jgi:hypothetical protein
MSRAEHTLQVGTVNTNKGRTEALLISIALSNRECRSAAPVSPSPPNYFARFCGQCCDGIETPEAREFSRSVSGQTHRRANFSQFRRLFVNIRGQPALAQSKCERQAADAGAHDADTYPSFRGHR